METCGQSIRLPVAQQIVEISEDTGSFEALEAVPGDDEADEADVMQKIWNDVGEKDELETLWRELPDSDDTVEVKIEKKRKAVLHDLKDKQVLICDSDEARVGRKM